MRLIKYRGTRWTIKELAGLAHISYSAMVERLKKHPVDEAVKLGRYAGRNKIELNGKLVTLTQFKANLKETKNGN